MSIRNNLGVRARADHALRGLLLLSSGLATSAIVATPVTAQVATAAAAPAAPADETIVVTGSILRRTDKETVSPVTSINVEALDQRGISTVQQAIQQLASNNGPALTNSFTANGAFAAGASAVSLRGLSTNSTLVLFDGLRAAYYPLADDGSRNFVDLNTIPDDVVERIDVLRDGASSSYGADAIAGVVNIVTKREIKGFNARAETGIAGRGDAATYRLSATAGFGDLEDNGVNAYISTFYYKQDSLKNSARPYPYNSDDLRNVCYQGTCGADLRVNGFNQNGVIAAFGTAGEFAVRPADPTTNVAIPGSRYVNLNANCPIGTKYTLNAADLALATTAPSTVCQVDYTQEYGIIDPKIERFGGTAKFTARVTDGIEAYAQVNFIQSTSSYTGDPAVVRGNAPTGILFPQYSTSSNAANFAPGSANLSLPVFVCPERVNCATSVNRKLNPNNPFAAAGQAALLVGRDLGTTTFNSTRNRAYRAALGVGGNITDNITFNFDATAMHDELTRLSRGYVYIQHLLDVIADGTYNFANPSSNSPALQNYLKPDNITNATSDQYQAQLVFGADLFELPGGKVNLAVGGSVRRESINAPSANDDANGPTQRYFTLNAFGTKGARNIYSAFFEAEAPIFDQLSINGSGRYDKYSTGQSNFSPKIGAKLKPVKELLLRGTYSRGFRIPSFAEANALPTTGYVTNSASLFNNAYLAQYGCTTTTFNACPTYIRTGSYGQTTLASPNLKPEKSRSFTGGIVLEPGRFGPVSSFNITLDYYNIKKTGVITQPSNSPALLAYYTGQPIPPGYTVIADAPDINFPNAKPRVAFVQSQLINANTQKTSGLDLGVNGQIKFNDDIKLTTSLDVTYIIKLETVFPDGTRERYDGTLGNFNLTSGNGTQKWHGFWQNTLDYGPAQVSATMNYFGGYDLSAQDQGTGYKDCGLSDGTVPCHVPRYITVDLNVQFKVNDNFTLYGSMLNVADKLPPLDPITYGAHLYNPVQGGTGIYGRYFKAGVKVGF